MDWYAESWPWKCCNVTNKKAALHCQKCGKHWQKAVPWKSAQSQPPVPKNKPKQKKDKKQDRSLSRKDKKNAKNKEKSPGGGDGAYQPSPPTPFQAAPGPVGHQPWFPTEVSPFAVAMREQASSSNQTVNANSELAASLRKAFAGQEDKLPPEVRETMERLEKNGKALIRSLHNTTNTLSKAKKALAEIVEAKKTHRSQWMSHLTESIGQWESQLNDFRTQQAFYQEQATRATAEISQARRMMDQLGAKAAGETPKPHVEEPEEVVTEIITDHEEEKLRKELTDKISACAAALGIDVKMVPTIIEDDGDAMEDANSKKRAIESGTEKAYDCGLQGPSCAASPPMYSMVGIPEYVLGRHLQVCQASSFVDTFKAMRAAHQLRWELLRDQDLPPCPRPGVCGALHPHDQLCGDVQPRVCRVPEDAGHVSLPSGADDMLVRDPRGREGGPLFDDDHWDSINHALAALFLEDGAVENEDEGMVLYLRTLCLVHPHRRISDEVRAVRLTADAPEWIPHLSRVWHDVIDAQEYWDVHVVHPSPPDRGGLPRVPFLVLHQFIPETEVAILATIADEHGDDDHRHYRHRATTLPGLATKDDVLRHARVDDLCSDALCHVESGEVIFNDMPIALHHGFGVVIEILRADEPPRDDQATDDEESDDQESEPHSDGDDAGPEQDQDDRRQDDRDDHDGFLLDPGSLADVGGHDDEREWLANIYQLDRPTRRLLLKMDTYEHMIVDLAQKLRIPVHDIVAVHEIGTPLVGQEESANNLILQLDGDIPPGNAGRLILLDYEQHQVDARWSVPASHRAVYLVNEWIARHHFLEIMGVAEYCQEQQGRCLVTLNGHLWPLQDRRVVQQMHGYYGRIIVPPPRRPRAGLSTADAVEQARTRHGLRGLFPLSPDEGMDGYDPTDPEPEPAGSGSQPSRPQGRSLDMSAVFRCFEMLDSHMFLPDYALSDQILLPPASQSWLTEWWHPGEIVDEIAIYYDGSYQASDDTAGIGIAAWICANGSWKFAGALSSQLAPGSSAYLAEQAASLVAAKFAYDLIKLASLAGSLPALCFYFDNMVVGKQLLGQWKAIQSQRVCHAVRDLMYLLTARYDVHPRACHVHSHQGEPGNELVDTLADHARRGIATHDLRMFLQDFTSKEHVANLDWTWVLFDKDYPVNWLTQTFELPPVATQPCPDVLPIELSDQPTTTMRTWKIDLTLCTFNVLSLKGADFGVASQGFSSFSGPAKQEILLEQLANDRYKIFALQETRLKKMHWKHDSRFFLFRSSATQRGHGGVLLGFNRQLPYATCIDTGRPQYFREDHFSVVEGDSRCLILRIRAPGAC
eukprot:Skav232217  [mRNA]  locus=scaffold2626:463847:468797:- [translate_table: standard]